MSSSQARVPVSEEAIIERLMQKARSIKRPRFVYPSVQKMEQELRRKRKALLGTSLSLSAIVYDEIDGHKQRNADSIDALTEYLSTRAASFWDKPYLEGLRFCRNFFKLAVPAIANPYMADESFDDLVLLSGTLVRSKKIFSIVIQELLERQENWEDDLHSLLYDFPEDYYCASFESGCLTAVVAFLGLIPDPMAGEEGNND